MSGSIHFQPWSPGGGSACSLLLLGESHYGDDDPNLTNKVIEEHISGAKRLSFFTKLAGAVSGNTTAALDQGTFYRSVAFYNYVQVPLASARLAPSSEDFNKSEGGFREILTRLKPEAILALGWRLYEGTPNFWSDGGRAWVKAGSIRGGSRTLVVGSFFLSGSRFRTGFISHPAGRGFSPALWHPLIHRFLGGDDGLS